MKFFSFFFVHSLKSKTNGKTSTKTLPAIHAEHPRAGHRPQPPRLRRQRMRGHPRLPPAAARPANRPRGRHPAASRPRQGTPRRPPLPPRATASPPHRLPLRPGRPALPSGHGRRGAGEKRRPSTPLPSAGHWPPTSPPSGSRSRSSSPSSTAPLPATASPSATPAPGRSSSSSSTRSSSAKESSPPPRTPVPSIATATCSPSSTSPSPTTSLTPSPKPSPGCRRSATSPPSSKNTRAGARRPKDEIENLELRI